MSGEPRPEPRPEQGPSDNVAPAGQPYFSAEWLDPTAGDRYLCEPGS